HVLAVTDGDLVGPNATHDDVVAGAGGDGVIAAKQRIGGLHLLVGANGARRQEYAVAVIAQDGIVAVAGGDRVVTKTADQQVGPVAYRDAVVTAHGRYEALTRRKQTTGKRQDPQIADDHVVAVAGSDLVGADAADHHVVAGPQRDDVASTVGRIAREHLF